MRIEQLIDELFEKMGDGPDVMPYLYNAKKKNFNPEKDWVFYSGPFWTNDEAKAAIVSFLSGKWLVSGEQVARFERAFSQRFNFASSVMVNSGSSANLVLISAAKKHFKWSDGDEVIVSPVGFPTTIAPLVQNNLKPRFVDINLEDLNFDLEQVEKVIGPQTKAIFLSPVLGNPPDMDKLVELAKRKNITLLLDGCDSLGTKWKGKELSDYAYATTCSFYPAHHITTGEGGMVSSNDQELVHLARSFAWWGRDCYCVGAANLSAAGACGKRFSNWLDDYNGQLDHKYLFSNMGYNLKPLDLQGAIGLEQLKKIDQIHQKRKEVKKRIEGLLLDNLGQQVKIPQALPHADTSWFGVPIICSHKEYKTKLVNYLEKNRIQTRNYFAGNILMHPAYKHLDDLKNFPVSNQVLDLVFFVGCYPGLTEEMFSYIGEVLKGYSCQ